METLNDCDHLVIGIRLTTQSGLLVVIVVIVPRDFNRSVKVLIVLVIGILARNAFTRPSSSSVRGSGPSRWWRLYGLFRLFGANFLACIYPTGLVSVCLRRDLLAVHVDCY